jgi:hypothetical protein
MLVDAHHVLPFLAGGWFRVETNELGFEIRMDLNG